MCTASAPPSGATQRNPALDFPALLRLLQPVTKFSHNYPWERKGGNAMGNIGNRGRLRENKVKEGPVC